MISSAPDRELVSWMAARSVQVPFPGAVSQMPLPGFASATSSELFTVKVAAWANAPVKNQQTKMLRYFEVQRVLFLPTDVLLVCLYCWRREPQRTKREHILCRWIFGAL